MHSYDTSIVRSHSAGDQRHFFMPRIQDQHRTYKQLVPDHAADAELQHLLHLAVAGAFDIGYFFDGDF